MPIKFPTVEDIPDIETSKVNIKILDPLLYGATESTHFALRHLNNFKVTPPKRDERDLIALLRMQLELFAVTHKSIRMLLRKAYREPDKRSISDGASLVREQIEKLLVCVLVLDNPTKWMKQYMRNALKNDLVEYFVELAEHSETPRLNDLLNNQYPTYLKAGQRPKVPGQKRFTLVSDFAINSRVEKIMPISTTYLKIHLVQFQLSSLLCAGHSRYRYESRHNLEKTRRTLNIESGKYLSGRSQPACTNWRC